MFVGMCWECGDTWPEAQLECVTQVSFSYHCSCRMSPIVDVWLYPIVAIPYSQ